MYREKVQNFIKNLRNEDEDDILFWDYKNIPMNDNLEEFLNKEEPDDNDLREKE